MAGALTTLAIKDGGGTSRLIKAWDLVGDGSGPFVFFNGIIDGTNGVDAVGEVGSSPQSNTILGRLKAITDAITSAVVSDALPYMNINVQGVTSVKGSSGRVFWLHAMNMSAGVRYLKFWNATSGNVTLGTTTPTFTFPIPTLGTSNGTGFTMHFPNGINFDTGITIAATTGIATSSSALPSANEVVVNLGYA